MPGAQCLSPQRPPPKRWPEPEAQSLAQNVGPLTQGHSQGPAQNSQGLKPAPVPVMQKCEHFRALGFSLSALLICSSPEPGKEGSFAELAAV